MTYGSHTKTSPTLPQCVPQAPVGNSSLTPLGNFCVFRQKHDILKSLWKEGEREKKKEKAKEHAAVDKPGVGHTPSTQRTAQVRGTI